MIDVDLLSVIRPWHGCASLSVREIARRTGFHNTIRKYLASGVSEPEDPVRYAAPTPVNFSMQNPGQFSMQIKSQVPVSRCPRSTSPCKELPSQVEHIIWYGE